MATSEWLSDERVREIADPQGDDRTIYYVEARALARRVLALEEELKKQLDYSIALQRCAEYAARGVVIPDAIASGAPHHAALLNDRLTATEARLAEALSQRDAAVAIAREALTPFTHPDLLGELSGNTQGDDSPLWGRNDATLTLGDFRRAARALATLTGEG